MDPQRSFNFLGRLDAASVVPTTYVKNCKSYREAVRMCFEHRRIAGMTQQLLAMWAGLRPQLISDYLNPDDAPHRRSLPAERIASFEGICGNTLITQYLARQQALTCLEQMQADQQTA